MTSVLCTMLSYTGADIDTLLVAPRHIERTDFFSSFKELLFEAKNVTNVRVSVVIIIICCREGKFNKLSLCLFPRLYQMRLSLL